MTGDVTKLLNQMRSAIASADVVAKRMRAALNAGHSAEKASWWADKYGRPRIVIDAPEGMSTDELVAAMWRLVFEQEVSESRELEHDNKAPGSV